MVTNTIKINLNINKITILNIVRSKTIKDIVVVNIPIKETINKLANLLFESIIITIRRNKNKNNKSK